MLTPIPCIVISIKARVRWEQLKNGVDVDRQDDKASKIKANLLNYELKFKAKHGT